jgi:hypothetical protein
LGEPTHTLDFQNTISTKIEYLINNCDVALILLTENGYDSKFVQQEIGYIKKCNKPILQVVQKGIESRLVGFNYGRDYILYNPENPQNAVELIEKTLLGYLKKETARKEKGAKIGFGLIAGLIVLALSND